MQLEIILVSVTEANDRTMASAKDLFFREFKLPVQSVILSERAALDLLVEKPRQSLEELVYEGWDPGVGCWGSCLAHLDVSLGNAWTSAAGASTPDHYDVEIEAAANQDGCYSIILEPIEAEKRISRVAALWKPASRPIWTKQRLRLQKTLTSIVEEHGRVKKMEIEP